MLSRPRISASHCGQCDGGETIDSPRGTRQMTTFRNDPIARPARVMKTTATTSTGSTIGDCVSGSGHGSAGSRRDRGSRRRRPHQYSSQRVVEIMLEKGESALGLNQMFCP